MYRREYMLASGALTVSLAGCLGSDGTAAAPAEEADDDGDTPAEGDGTPTDTDGEPSPTATPESGSPDVTIGEPHLGYDESGYGTDIYAAVTLTNEGDAVSGPVTVTADWFDADGNYLDDSTDSIASLNPGETWRAHVYAFTSDEEKIDEVEVSGEYQRDPLTVPDGVELVSSVLLSGEKVKVRGEVANNLDRTVDYISFHGKVYNEAGEVMGEAWTNELDIPAGETWRADPEWRGRERTSEAVDHEVVLEANVY